MASAAKWDPKKHPRWKGAAHLPPGMNPGWFRPTDRGAAPPTPPAAQVLIEAIESGVVDEQPLYGGWMAETWLVRFANGRRGVHKHMLDAPADVFGAAAAAALTAERQADAEQLAGLLGLDIGAPVPAVVRAGDDEVYMQWVSGTDWARFLDSPAPAAQVEVWPPEIIDVVATVPGIRLGLFDLLTDNWDRSKNWKLLAVDETPIGLDHAFAWSWRERGGAPPGQPPESHDLSPFSHWFVTVQRGGHTAAGLPAGVVHWSDNPLHPDDVTWLRARLDGVRHDFAGRGREDWWEFAAARLQAVAAHATGRRRLFGV